LSVLVRFLDFYHKIVLKECRLYKINVKYSELKSDFEKLKFQTKMSFLMSFSIFQKFIRKNQESFTKHDEIIKYQLNNVTINAILLLSAA
jgi:hypothetical protein